MHPTPILATFSNISGRPKDMTKVNIKERNFIIKIIINSATGYILQRLTTSG